MERRDAAPPFKTVQIVMINITRGKYWMQFEESDLYAVRRLRPINQKTSGGGLNAKISLPEESSRRSATSRDNFLFYLWQSDLLCILILFY